MLCIEIGTTQKEGTLVPTERPIPEPGPDEVLIKVAGAGVNRPDIFQRRGMYPAPPGASDLPGLEVAGEIVATGSHVTQWRTGDKVCALLPGGGYAEYAIAHAGSCLPIPEHLSLVEAASLPETYFTVWDNVFLRGGLCAGQSLLVHGGGSGIGTTAIQLAKAFGATVYTTAGSEDKCQRCLALGADYAFNYHEGDFTKEIKTLSQGKGVNVILDMIGGDYVAKNIALAAFRGRIVSIAFLNGSKVQLDLAPVMLKQLVITGSTMRARPAEEKAALAAQLIDQVWPLFGEGKLQPVVTATFPLRDALKAQQLMESRAHFGKIVLTTD